MKHFDWLLIRKLDKKWYNYYLKVQSGRFCATRSFSFMHLLSCEVVTTLITEFILYFFVPSAMRKSCVQVCKKLNQWSLKVERKHLADFQLSSGGAAFSTNRSVNKKWDSSCWFLSDFCCSWKTPNGGAAHIFSLTFIFDHSRSRKDVMIAKR